MAIFGAGIQGQIYGYGINPGTGIVRFLVRCIPCVNTEILAPAIALVSGYPVASISAAYPAIQISSLIGALAVLALFAGLDLRDIKPVLDLEECECLDDDAPIIIVPGNNPVGAISAIASLVGAAWTIRVRWAYPSGCIVPNNPPKNLVAQPFGVANNWGIEIDWDSPNGCV